MRTESTSHVPATGDATRHDPMGRARIGGRETPLGARAARRALVSRKVLSTGSEISLREFQKKLPGRFQLVGDICRDDSMHVLLMGVLV